MQGDNRRACKVLGRALAVLQASPYPHSEHTVRIYMLLGHCKERMGDAHAAAEAWQAGVTAAAREVPAALHACMAEWQSALQLRLGALLDSRSTL